MPILSTAITATTCTPLSHRHRRLRGNMPSPCSRRAPTKSSLPPRLADGHRPRYRRTFCRLRHLRLCPSTAVSTCRKTTARASQKDGYQFMTRAARPVARRKRRKQASAKPHRRKRLQTLHAKRSLRNSRPQLLTPSKAASLTENCISPACVPELLDEKPHACGKSASPSPCGWLPRGRLVKSTSREDGIPDSVEYFSEASTVPHRRTKRRHPHLSPSPQSSFETADTLRPGKGKQDRALPR